MVILAHSKSPKFWRSCFYSTLDQFASDPDRSLIQGEAFTRNRKISLPLTARLIASLSSNSVRQQTLTFCKNNHTDFTESAFCQARQKFDHLILKNASLDFAHHVSCESSLYKGKYRLIGIDGSCFPILPNLEEPQNLVERYPKSSWALHFNAALTSSDPLISILSLPAAFLFMRVVTEFFSFSCFIILLYLLHRKDYKHILSISYKHLDVFNHALCIQLLTE